MLGNWELNLDFCNKIEQTPINKVLSKVSKERKVEVPEQFKKQQKTSNELDKHYSGWWRWLSEGGSEPIYYVGGDDKYSVIEAKGHSQWKRNLWGGKEVGAHGHRWFGPRELPFKKSKGEKEGESAINRYLKEIKRLQEDELKQLSDFLNKYDDEQWCEIIDVIWNCNDFRKDLMKNQSGPINRELNLSLEELTKLSGHDEINTAWGDLKTVIAKAISIKKIDNYRNLIGRYGVDCGCFRAHLRRGESCFEKRGNLTNEVIYRLIKN